MRTSTPRPRRDDSLWSQDLAGRPPAHAQPDPALELLAAEQAAVNDAGRHVIDTAALLVSERPVPFASTTGTWLRAEQTQAELAGQQAVAAGEVIAHRIDLGTDPQAPEPGVGRAQYEKQHDDAQHDEEAAEAAAGETRRAVQERGATVPETTGLGTLLRLWVAIWWPKAVFALLDTMVSATAYKTAVIGAEQTGDAWAFAAIIGLATAIVATCLAKTLRLLGGGGSRRLAVGLVVAALVVLGATVAVVSVVRGRAVDADLAVAAQQLLPATDDAGAQTQAAVAALDARASGGLVTLLVAVVLVLSVFAVTFLHIRSTAPEQLEHVGALRTLARARTRTARLVQKVDSIRARLEFAAHDIELAQAEWGFYADVVLPALAQQKVDAYTAELTRQVGDPAFTDALRSLPAHEPFSPVPLAQQAGQPDEPRPGQH